MGLFLSSLFCLIDLFVDPMPVSDCFITVDLLVKVLKSGGVSPPTLVLFFIIGLAILGHLHFYTHFRISLSVSTRSPVKS